MVTRYSSRTSRIFTELLEDKLDNALSYDRIAGYFSSSILDIAGEAIERMDGKVRIICNSELDIEDVKTAQLVDQAQKREWCDFKPEELPTNHTRFQRLYDFLNTGKLEVRVLPRERFGLAHGKAGIITMKDGSQTTFLGSVNETYNAWKNNYELVWEDNSEDAVKWVQEEFDSLWNDDYAKPLSSLVLNDIKRFSEREVYKDVNKWKEDNEKDGAACVAVESPLYRKSFGLWDHQKYFVNLAFELHKTKAGARLINADQVGLGKTIQLAMAAMLMSLWDNKPVLALVPKTLQKQWRDDMFDLMGIPSAYWNGNGWIDESDHWYGLPIDECPRRIGIISQGIIVNGSNSCIELQDKLLHKNYACVIVDECHRARRKNLQLDAANKKPEMNKLYSYLCQISSQTHSMLLATATPIQINPVEAWDLLNILSQGSDSVLGSNGSQWRKVSFIQDGLDIVSGKKQITDPSEAWEWIRNPLPLPAGTDPLFAKLRQETKMSDDEYLCTTPYLDLSHGDKNKLRILATNMKLTEMYNPYIVHIIRRERAYLENTFNPNTHLPYLQPIKVNLYGESTNESIPLDGYLVRAYNLASEFCDLIQKRCRAAGLFKTLLLRRIGSSMLAGLITGQKILSGWNLSSEDIEEDDDDDEINSELKNLTSQETSVLKEYVNILVIALEQTHITDPKLQKIIDILDFGTSSISGVKTKPWKDYGCILFSQYLDTAHWVATSLSLHYPNIAVGLYAGGSSSKLFINGEGEYIDKNDLKAMVKDKKIRLLVGTDAASEGLNLQSLGALINIDLPWNPTRLEQRKGRIQRIGQVNPEVFIYNLKYTDSVEDRVHELLSSRLENIYNIFGQVPDILQDVWVDVALGKMENAKKRIEDIPETNPFAIKYNKTVENVDWESCTKVLTTKDVVKNLSQGWN